uniref:Uncharacterized protein n=1 Tax=viral metagenome TaxID=1070528 RepID=A0A6M3KE01_9ZZZZ
MNEADKLKNALKKILFRAMDHPSFDGEAFETRDLDALIKEGGDVFDWTMVAITAADALEGKS